MPELKQIMVFAALCKLYKRSHWNEDIFKDRDSPFTVVSKNTSHCSSLGSDLVGNWTFRKNMDCLSQIKLSSGNKPSWFVDRGAAVNNARRAGYRRHSWQLTGRLYTFPPEPSVVGGGTADLSHFTIWKIHPVTLHNWSYLRNTA